MLNAATVNPPSVQIGNPPSIRRQFKGRTVSKPSGPPLPPVLVKWRMVKWLTHQTGSDWGFDSLTGLYFWGIAMGAWDLTHALVELNTPVILCRRGELADALTQTSVPKDAGSPGRWYKLETLKECFLSIGA